MTEEPKRDDSESKRYYIEWNGVPINPSKRPPYGVKHARPDDTVDKLLNELAGNPDYAAILTLSCWVDGGYMASITLIDWEWADDQDLLVAKLPLDPAGYDADSEPEWTPSQGFTHGRTAHGSTPLEALQELRAALIDEPDQNSSQALTNDN